MLFNSLVFIFIFFPTVACVFFLIGFLKYIGVRNTYISSIWLSIASLFYYGYMDATYIWLLLLSILTNYFFGLAISSAGPGKRKVLLTVAVILNLTALCYYKYFAFLVASLNGALGTTFVTGSILLPLGISFFTFTQIAFLVDVYQGKVKEYNLAHYVLFVTYFPHLIAGPILHHAQMMPQFARANLCNVNWNNMSVGMMFFIIGLAKKVLIADTCAGFSTPVFNAAKLGQVVPFIDAWLGAYAYTLQLYFDFSGYCDMAIGISYMLNIRLPYNFNSPYKAFNIIDFWRRWHITLSTFLRDYLYIPLGGNRSGPVRRYINLLLTMLLGGLWHGAGWTFIIWGGMHGFYLIVNHGFHAFRKKVGWANGALGWPGRAAATVITFFFVMIAWVVFRAENMTALATMFHCMTGGNGFALTPRFVYYCNLFVHPLLIPGLILIWAFPNTQEWIGIQEQGETSTGILPAVPHWWTWVVLGIIFNICILFLLYASLVGIPSEFLYYQF